MNVISGHDLLVSGYMGLVINHRPFPFHRIVSEITVVIRSLYIPTPHSFEFPHTSHPHCYSLIHLSSSSTRRKNLSENLQLPELRRRRRPSPPLFPGRSLVQRHLEQSSYSLSKKYATHSKVE
ncbi:hypothetical protein HanIR_Chr09g0433841 [Helianthus annuus]|nr:hypothetical protein HanIR_Chr09g0433841 [Helianthus annuus]